MPATPAAPDPVGGAPAPPKARPADRIPGPATMAPTTVTVESVTTPTAASRHANVRNSRNVTLSVASSRVRPISSSQTKRVGGIALGLVFGLMRSRRQHRVEHLQRDRAPMLHVDVLELLDDAIGAFARDVGGDLVADRFQCGPRIQQNVRDADFAAKHVDDRVAQLLGRYHPQMQHGATLSAHNRRRGHLEGRRANRRPVAGDNRSLTAKLAGPQEAHRVGTAAAQGRLRRARRRRTRRRHPRCARPG